MKSFLTLQQLKKRIQQLNNLIGKFPTVRTAVRRWGFELTVLEGMIERLEAQQTETPKQLTIWDVKPMQKFQVKTGSEWHTTERRGAMVTVNGVEIYKALKPLSQEWEMVGNKGKHGKWCIAEYEIPAGARVEFKATANGRDPIVFNFVVGDGQSVDVDGFSYGSDTCGWIVSI